MSQRQRNHAITKRLFQVKDTNAYIQPKLYSKKHFVLCIMNYCKDYLLHLPYCTPCHYAFISDLNSVFLTLYRLVDWIFNCYMQFCTWSSLIFVGIYILKNIFCKKLLCKNVQNRYYRHTFPKPFCMWHILLLRTFLTLSFLEFKYFIDSPANFPKYDCYIHDEIQHIHIENHVTPL